jgi:pyrroline-5-carboxylate reductase
MNNIGFIGCGNMGGTLARAVSQAVPGRQLFLSNRTAAKAADLAQELGCRAVPNETIAQECRLIFLAVKPQVMPAVLEAVRPILASRTDRFVLCTMAAGLSCARIQELAGGDYPVLRIMPNTPAAVGEGMIPYCSVGVTKEERTYFVRLLSAAGRLDPLPEELIDAASCVSGCGPAWAYQFIEALADGGVAAGLPRAKAQQYAAQMLLGSAKMVLESGRHPGALKDAVCSPGGSTIQGVRVLEERAFRGAVTDAVLAAYEKTREMGKG